MAAIDPEGYFFFYQNRDPIGYSVFLKRRCPRFHIPSLYHADTVAKILNRGIISLV